MSKPMPLYPQQQQHAEPDSFPPVVHRKPHLPATEVGSGQLPLLNRGIEIERVVRALKMAIAQHSPGTLVRNSAFGIVAVSGGGKTEMLRQVCENLAHAAFAPSSCHTAYFNWQFYDCVPSVKLDVPDAAKFFAMLIMRSCGEPRRQAARIVAEVADPLLYAVKFLRSVLGGETLPMVICIDQLIELAVECRGGVSGNDSKMLQAMMEFQDVNNSTASEPPVYFVFSALHVSLADACLEQRPVTFIPLRPFTLENVFTCVGPRLTAAALSDRKLYQLLLSCAGHPRAVVEGLREQAERLCLPESKLADRDGYGPRQRIIQVVKVSPLIEERETRELVHRWFDFTNPKLSPEEDKEHRINFPLLHDSHALDGTTVTLFFPFLLLHWSSWHREKRTFEDLRLALKADSQVLHGNSTASAGVFQHFEAVRRLAANEKPFKLADYFATSGVLIGEYLQYATGNITMKCNLPGGHSVCDSGYNLPADFDKIIWMLTIGCIVVISDPTTENGIQYLAPFHDAIDSTLVAIAGVQVKFTEKGSAISWEVLHAGALAVLAPFAAAGFRTFPVIFSNQVQGNLTQEAEELMSDSVVFLETATLHWTRPLGVLQLHIEKLGNAVREVFPFLGM